MMQAGVIEIDITPPLGVELAGYGPDLGRFSQDIHDPLMAQVLVLDDGQRRATFLPKVWYSLQEPAAFVAELKRKAGIPCDYWPDSLRVLRYHTETFCEREVLAS